MKIWKGKSPEHICFLIGVCAIISSLLLIVLQSTGIFMLHRVLPSCSFYALTHLPCPSCGMTRSVESLFSFHIMESFLYNPVVLYVFLFYLVFMTSHTLERLNNLRKTPNPQIRGMKYHIGYVYFGVVLLFAQWIMKLILSF